MEGLDRRAVWDREGLLDLAASLGVKVTHFSVHEKSEWSFLASTVSQACTGPRGATGAIGAMGRRGPVGPRGFKGSVGDKGNDGRNGAPGCESSP